MNLQTGKPDHIEDWLVEQKTGQWFGWSDASNKVYANLVIHDGSTKPTEVECNDGLKALQDAFDAKEYARKRVAAYPKLTHQLDMLYWDKKNGTNKWVEAVDKVKSDNPKP